MPEFLLCFGKQMPWPINPNGNLEAPKELRPVSDSVKELGE